jgi:acyl carrier protein phosphodiesterase
MNYLAHLYLAGDDPGLVLGSLLGDFVKGRLEGQYDEPVIRGIRLHRHVDTFTDSHPVPRASRNRFAPPWRRFAGVIVDVCYDHFLARHWPRFADTPLDEFSSGVYGILRDNHQRLPPRLQVFAPRLIHGHLLGSYRDLEGVERALRRLSRRLRRPVDLSLAMGQVQSRYAGLEADFLQFFPEVVRRARAWRADAAK